MTEDGKPNMTTVAKKRRSPLVRWLKRVTILLLILVVLLIVATPLLVSGGLGRSLLLSFGEEALTAPMTVGEVSMNWTGGVEIKDLRVDQPQGFGSGPALEIARVEADCGLVKLITGRWKMHLVVRGVRIKAVRDREGNLNFDKLMRPKVEAKGSSGGRPGGAGGGKPKPDEATPLHLYASVTDTVITLVDELAGTAGRATVEFKAENEDFGRPLRVKGAMQVTPLSGGVKPGRITWQGQVGLASMDTALDLVIREIDLATWRPLLPLDKDITSLTGTAEGDVKVTRRGDILASQGEIRIKDAAATVASLGPVPLRQKLITLHTNVTTPQGGGDPDLSGVTLDCGPLTANLLPPGEADKLLPGRSAVGARIHLDLARLPSHPALRSADTRMGGTLSLTAAAPETGRKDTQIRIEGKGLHYAGKDLTTGPITLRGTGSLTGGDGLRMLKGGLELAVSSLEAAGTRFKDIRSLVDLADGRLALRLDRCGFNGGVIKGQASLDLMGDRRPFKMELGVDGSVVQRSIAPLLAYFLPFAIGPDDAGLGGTLGLRADLSGALTDAADRLSLEGILGSLSGGGKLNLADFTFNGPPQLQQILAAFKQGGVHIYKGLKTDFRIGDNRIVQKGIKIRHKGQDILVKGSTTMKGELDYSFDFSKLLAAGGKDGRKVLEFLGGKAMPLRLGGTITSPKPEIKLLDLDGLLEKGKEDLLKKGQKELDRALKRGIEDLFGRKKKRRKK